MPTWSTARWWIPKNFPQDVDITLVEGAVSSEEDLHKIKIVRERTKILVSLGDCAVTANVPGMRNPFGTQGVYDRAYRENVTFDPGIPDQVVPGCCRTSRPVHEFVQVDVFVPGCPPSADTIYYVVTELLEGRQPELSCKNALWSLVEMQIRSKMQAGSTIVIDPVTRIEGHSKITLHLDEQGQVEDARFHVTQFRGFEKFCEGRPFSEMPSLMARICGICPVSHLIASAKACDALLAVKIPPTADKLRRIFGLAQVVQSHALSLFHLSSPDLLLGWTPIPPRATSLACWRKIPQLARDGIRLRQFGQQIIERLGGSDSSGVGCAGRRQRASSGRSRRHSGGNPGCLGHRGAHP